MAHDSNSPDSGITGKKGLFPFDSNKKTIIGIAIVFIAVVALLAAERSLRLQRGIPESSEQGQSLPTGSKLKNLATGETVTFEKFKGKVILINFWASWCEACMAEMPSIQQLYQKFRGDGLEVIAINVDDKPEVVGPPIVQELGLTFPIYVDSSGVLSQSFDVVAIPFSIVADRESKIIWTESGERDWSSDEVVNRIQKLLGDKK